MVILKEDISISDYFWLKRNFKKGEKLKIYHGPTYNCISKKGIAVTEMFDDLYFFEIPLEKIEIISEENLENDYFIESINIRIEDSSTGEGYYYTLTSDLGYCAFYQEAPPTKISKSIDDQLTEIYQIAFDTPESEKSFVEEKPTLSCTGKWFQGETSGEMELSLLISNGSIKGNGEDPIGLFEIDGYLFDNHITFKKSYFNKHSLLYFGIKKPNSEVFEGEWFITKSNTKGTFQLTIPNL